MAPTFATLLRRARPLISGGRPTFFAAEGLRRKWTWTAEFARAYVRRAVLGVRPGVFGSFSLKRHCAPDTSTASPRESELFLTSLDSQDLVDQDDQAYIYIYIYEILLRVASKKQAFCQHPVAAACCHLTRLISLGSNFRGKSFPFHGLDF